MDNDTRYDEAEQGAVLLPLRSYPPLNFFKTRPVCPNLHRLQDGRQRVLNRWNRQTSEI